MKVLASLVVAVLCEAMLAVPTSAGTLKLEIRNGLVTLDARDVPVRDILAEWARVGRTRIENREQVGGAPVTLTLKDVPEREALETILRSVTGYIVAPRPAPLPDVSIFDVVYVLAGARPVSAQGAGALSQTQSQQINRGVRGTVAGPGGALRPGQPTDDTADDPVPPVMRPGFTVEQMPYPGAAGMGAQIQLSPGMVPPQTGQANQAMPYSSLPGEPTAGGATVVPPGSTTTPGMVAPNPAGTAPKPIKPPGRPQGRP